MKMAFELLSNELTIAIIKAAIFPGVLFQLVSVLMMMWFERKVMARIHMRYGPYYVGKFGLLQTLADLLKLLLKEIIVPLKSRKFLFATIPALLLLSAFTPVTVIPFSESWYVFRFPYSAIFVIAILSMIPTLEFLAGWAGGSKYSFIGGYRAATQQVSYEVTLFLSILPSVILAGSMDLIDITKAQSQYWFILLVPLAALAYFIASLAELERIPFDIPEAESEIVFGWKTDYSGILFGFQIFSSYIFTFVEAALFTVLFLGGWMGPFLPPILWFLVKTYLVFFVMVVVRAGLPRFRLDQLLNFGWKVLFPLAILNIFLAVLVGDLVLV